MNNNGLEALTGTLPRLGSRVRIPSPAPNYPNNVMKLMVAHQGHFCKGCMDRVRLFPLYLPEVLAAIRNNGLILIPGGERKVDLLRHLGYDATCKYLAQAGRNFGSITHGSFFRVVATHPKSSSCRTMMTRGESMQIQSAPRSPPLVSHILSLPPPLRSTPRG
jgi:hypothetical protein